MNGNQEVLSILIDSLKRKSSNRSCQYVFTKGKKQGEKCDTKIDEAYPRNNYCCKHSKYENNNYNIIDFDIIIK